MAKWYIKEFGKTTGVSVRTLHHYDQIGLLKPSMRSNSGYRLYSEDDLFTLQKIAALKFFGYKLSQIKSMLNSDLNKDMLEQFNLQSNLLKNQADELLKASETLDSIVTDSDVDKSIKWENIIKTIEVYHMTQKLDNAWVANVLNQDDLAEYSKFEQDLKARASGNDKQQASDYWAQFVAKVEKHIEEDPTSEQGRALGKQCMDWVNNLYGKKHAALRRKLWEQGFMQGKADQQHSLSPAATAWLDKAMDAHYRHWIYQLLARIENPDSTALVNEWQTLLDDMCGDDTEGMQSLYQAIDQDTIITPVAKQWLAVHFRGK